MKTKAKKLIITTKREIFNNIKANHPSIYNGDGLDFSELREYRLGDDSRFIDHKTSAKKQKLYVRVFKEERELNIVTISLLGGSSFFGTKISKQEFIAKIVATISLSTIFYQDRFSSAIYTDEIKRFVMPSKKLSFSQKAVEEILEFNPKGEKVDFKNLESEIKRKIHKKSIIFLIGDFFDIVELKKLNSFHEVIVVIVRDRFEEKLDELGNITFSDLNISESIECTADKNFLKSYQKAVREHDRKLYHSLKKDRVKFVKIYTDENPTKKLTKLFWSRR